MHIKINWFIRLIIMLLISFSSIFGCSQQNTKVVIAPDSVILAFGDSLTKGTGVKLSQSYPAVLQKTLGLTVINKGVPGETSSKGLKRLEKTLELTLPDLVILCHGGNDILKRLPLTKLEDNLAQMIEIIEAHGAQVLLIGVPKPALNLSPLPLYQNLASHYSLTTDLNSLSDLLEQAAMKSDQVHLNEAGYRELALNLAEKIEIL